MSMSKPKIPPPPAAAPAPASVEPARQELGGQSEETAGLKGRKKGRSSLRIDLRGGGTSPGPGVTGINVPRA